MSYNVNVENAVANITIELTVEETATFIDQQVTKKIAGLEVDGFRKGKMPRAMFIKKYGENSVYPEVIDAILNAEYPKVIMEEKLHVIDSPEFDFAKMTLSKEDGFKISGTVALMPEITVEGYKEIKEEITLEEVKVSKKDVDAHVATLLEDKAVVEVVERAAKDGDIVVFDFEGFVDGVAFEGGQSENYSLTLGSGQFIPGFEAQLEGLSAGESKDVVVTFPEEYQAEDLAGKEATFKCLMHEVKAKILPELTDEIAAEIKDFEAQDVKSLNKEIKEKLQAQKVEQAKNKYNFDIISKLIEMANFEAPQALINQETDNALENFKQQIASQGMQYEMYLQMLGGDEQILRSQMDTESKRRVEEMLVMDAVVKAEDMQVTDEEATAKVEELSTQVNMTVEEVMNALGGDLDRLKRDIAYDKAYKLVLGE